MITQDFDAIIFDCDGTLVDSEPITVRTLVDFVEQFGLQLDYDEALALFIGRDMQMIVKVLEERIGKPLPEEFANEYRKRQSAGLRKSLQTIPGAHELLESINRPTCVASNAPQYKIKLNLKVTKLDKFFDKDRIYSAYDIRVWKPAPDLFLHAAEKMNVQPHQCVVIEDSLAGIQAGIDAGMQTIGYAANKDVQPTDQVPFVHDLRDLIPMLGS